MHNASYSNAMTQDTSKCVATDTSMCAATCVRAASTARPTQCRTFPWWPQHLVSDYDWQLAARECEGITLASASVVEPSNARTDASLASPSRVAFDDVLPHAILHDVRPSFACRVLLTELLECWSV